MRRGAYCRRGDSSKRPSPRLWEDFERRGVPGPNLTDMTTVQRENLADARPLGDGNPSPPGALSRVQERASLQTLAEVAGGVLAGSTFLKCAHQTMSKS